MTGSSSENTSPVAYREIRRTVVYMVLVDVLVLGVLAWLDANGAVSLYPTGLIVVFFVFFGDVLFLRSKLPRRRPVVGVRVSNLAWYGVAVVTASAAVGLVNLVGEPSWFHAAQAFIGIALAAWAWWMVLIVRKMQRREQAAAGEHDARH